MSECSNSVCIELKASQETTRSMEHVMMVVVKLSYISNANQNKNDNSSAHIADKRKSGKD